jgi:protein TonB
MSNTRIIGLGFVVLLHLLLGYAFITGLALKTIKKIIAPIEAVQVKEEAPPPEEPPPPPPKEQEIPPFVPPPEVTVQTDAPPPPTISTQSVAPPPPQPTFVPAPAPPAPAPAPAGPTTRATPANARVFEVSEDDYPPASLRAEEEGVTQVKVAINAQGRVETCEVQASSNFPKLDERTCKIAQSRWRFKPALTNGAPVADTLVKRIRWQIRR